MAPLRVRLSYEAELRRSGTAVGATLLSTCPPERPHSKGLPRTDQSPVDAARFPCASQSTDLERIRNARRR